MRPIALVTGATAGIGAEFARQLAERGHDLVLVARDRGRLEAAAGRLAADHGAAVEILCADLLDAAQLASVETRIRATEHPIDYLVSNAGFGLGREFDGNDVEEEVRMFELLATVPLRLAHAALAQMLPRGCGHIVTVASVAGFVPLGSYSAAKTWALSFSRWANAYYRSSGVTVTAVAPGFVRSEFHARIGIARESLAPRWMWLDAEPMVRLALLDAERRRAVSIPTVRYKLITALGRLARPAIMTAVARRGRKARR